MEKNWVELGDFKFRDSFTGLTEAQFSQALQMVNAQFSGVYTLWSILPPEEARAKRELCINYLIAWELVQIYPEYSNSVAGTGGMPLSSKKIGPIFLKYKNLVQQEGSMLSMLTTNAYGIQALTMIQSAPEMFMLYA